MQLARRGAMTVLVTALVLAGCGDDDNGPSNSTLTEQETAALSNALSQSGIVEGGEALLFPLVVGGTVEYGTFTVPASAGASGGTYDGTAFQAFIDLTVDGEQVRVCESGVLGWKGLDADAQTVDELIVLGGLEEDVAACGDGTTGDIALGEAFAAYYDGIDDLTYYGVTGLATLADASFGGSAQDCSPSVPGLETITCAYRYGRMSGSFRFTAQTGGEEPAVEFPETSYDLPAVRVDLSGSVTTGAPTAGLLRVLPFRAR